MTRLAVPTTFCTYCGDPATEMDHLRPKTWTGEGVRRHTEATVPACRHCNSIIGDRCGPSIEDRRAYVQERLAKRYGKYLRAVDYTLDELAEFGRSLRTHICAGLIRKRWIQARLAWPENPQWMADPAQVEQLRMWCELHFAGDEDYERAKARVRRAARYTTAA